MEKEYLKVAAMMYGIDDYNQLPEDLYSELVMVDALCRRNNGRLRSKQMIASVVARYKIHLIS